MSAPTPPTPEKAAPAPMLAPAQALPVDREVHLLDRLSVLYKYQKAVAAMFCAVVLWVMVDSYTKIPIYESRVRIQIDDETPGMGTPAEIAQNFTVGDPEVYQNTQHRIIQGRELGFRVVKKLNLQTVPEFNGQGPKPTPLGTTIANIKRYAMAPVRAVIGGSDPTPQASTAAPANLDAFVNSFVSRVSVEQVRGSRLVDVIFKGSDPDFAAKAVNTLADEYVSQNLELKVNTTAQSLEWLTAEVARQREQVEQSERAMAQYREDKDAGALADNQNIVISRLNQLNDNVTRARGERIQKEAVWKQVQAAGSDRDSLAVIIQNPLVQTLKSQLSEQRGRRALLAERYGPKHDEMIKIDAQIADTERQYEAQLQKAQQNAKAEYESVLSQEMSLTRDLNSQQGAAMSLNRKGIDYSVLQRTAESNQTLYNSLLTREKELRVVANSRSNNVRVVDRAQVGSLISPNHRQDWIYALFFATLLSVGLAFGMDYLDDTVKTPEDISHRLKLRFLGLVPIISGDRNPLLSGPVPHDFSEAFRSLRTSLVSQASSDGPHIIAITSAQPLEGKTTTAVNIAMVLAVGGARVLLVDADMRRPNVHKTLRLTNDRGLSQLLAGQARMREVVQRTHDPNLMVITAGRTPSNPSELLSSERMRALVSGLESGPFDWVLIDTPPVLAVTDAVIVAPLVEAVVFVIGAQMTPWRLADRAVSTIMAANPRSIAAVLNKVDFHRNKYYYSRYYGHQYKSYYQEAPAA
ncbi:MAG TPA: polysaccharide biosynthesis tyrosine autokinase [Vicinamibacterales bacterium]|nr:polysaccharide biosynthesis tyrosine autokinase [Vicinamibacterales bacterium]